MGNLNRWTRVSSAHRPALFVILPVLAAAVLFSGGDGPAQAQDKKAPRMATYAGRWHEITKVPAKRAGQLIGTLDIVPCGKEFCGIGVDKSGVCQPVMFHVQAEGNGPDEVVDVIDFDGTASWRHQDISASVEIDPKSHVLALVMGNGDVSPYSRDGGMPVYQGQFVRAGKAKCAAHK